MTTLTTNLAQLVISAQAAANEAAASSDILGQESLKLAKFSESGFDRADYPTWSNAFNAQLEMYQAFSKQDSPATIAAKKRRNPKASPKAESRKLKTEIKTTAPRPPLSRAEIRRCGKSLANMIVTDLEARVDYMDLWRTTPPEVQIEIRNTWSLMGEAAIESALQTAANKQSASLSSDPQTTSGGLSAFCFPNFCFCMAFLLSAFSISNLIC